MEKDEIFDDFLNRTGALRNQCTQLGSDVEEYELKMYILRRLWTEYDPEVRVLESQRNISVNYIRFTLKQEEEVRTANRKQEKTSGAKYKAVRKVIKEAGTGGNCYNSGIEVHSTADCNRSK